MNRIFLTLALSFVITVCDAQNLDTLPMSLWSKLSGQLDQSRYSESNEEVLFLSFSFDSKGKMVKAFFLRWSQQKYFDSTAINVQAYNEFESYLNRLRGLPNLTDAGDLYFPFITKEVSESEIRTGPLYTEGLLKKWSDAISFISKQRRPFTMLEFSFSHIMPTEY